MAKTKPKPKAAPGGTALRRKAKQLLACRDAGREAYQQADALLQELLDSGLKPGDCVPLGGGTALRITDSFTNRHGQPTNKIWKPAGINRFDAELIQE